MKVYVDSSVVLRRILDQPGSFQNWSEWQLVVTSELLRVETHRAVDRLRVKGKLLDPEVARIFDSFRLYTASFQQVPIGARILERAASAFPTALGALDAIHLATALIWMKTNDQPLTFLTHDIELGIAAKACGLEVKPAP